MRIGIDLGGTKIEVAVLDAQGEVVYRQRQPTPAGDYRATIKQVVALIDAAESHLGVRCSVGVATPGSLSLVTGRLRNSNSICLNDQPIQQDLSNALDGREVRIANDANCFALSEASDGAGQSAQSVFGVILGTGVGGGMVLNKQLVTGANAIAGEWGHNPLPWMTADEFPGRRCYCGRDGCIETFLSGPAFEFDHTHQTQQKISPAKIIASAAHGDPDCLASYRRYTHRLARALAHVINLIDPDVIVLGGGMSNIPTLSKDVSMLWDQWIFSDRVNTKLHVNAHGDSSGVRGAAWLWP